MHNTSLARRLGAILYDSILLFPLLMMVGTPFVVWHGDVIEPQSHLPFRLALAATAFCFFVGFWSWRGRTLGMQSWRLQLERIDGGRISPADAVKRFFAALLSWAAGGLGFLWQLVDRDKLTWHDRLSGTRLVHYPKGAN